MKVMRGSWQQWDPPDGRASITIGVLDGVHIGHRALLSRLDDSLVRTVLTFDPHPIQVLRPGTPPRLITTIDERVDLFESVGVESVGVLDLAEIKEMSPDEFVTDILVGKVGTEHLVTGKDFRFGRDRVGDVDLLVGMAAKQGFTVEPIELVADDGAAVSSSRIRHLIESGRVASASALLGSRFSVTNTVVHGDKRGRGIGFPTANIEPPSEKVVPGTGVYACFARLGGEEYDAAVNVGVRPTFGGGELVIEAYLLGFDDDVYGQELTLSFVDYIRPELKFDEVGQLVTQMHRDVSTTRGILEGAQTRI